MSTPARSTTGSYLHAAAELAVDVDTASLVDANDLRDEGDVDDAPASRAELPLEADPADVAEQDALVPYDDDER